MKKANVFVGDHHAGIIGEVEGGYEFKYLAEYLASDDPQPVSLTLPLTDKPYINNVLFPFFDGLIPEGWLLDIAERNWKISSRDRFSMLLACCKDCVGNVSIIPVNMEES